MALIKRLTKREVDTLGPGFYADGANLYLHVRPPSDAQRQAGQTAGSRAWVFRYQKGAGKAAKQVSVGLGSTAHRSLAQARELAAKMRTALADGNDPANVLQVKRGDQPKTFKEYAAELIEAKKAGWKSSKHAKQWTTTLEAYAYPAIGKKRPCHVTVADIKAILNPMWATKTETASRLRQRIEAVIDYAAVEEGDDRRNPARWKGNLDTQFPSPRKVSKPKPFAALKYEHVPALMSALRKKSSMSALNLRWTILTAARSTEARAAVWDEIKLDEKVWVVPEDRMKRQKEHRVPLCDEAMQILAEMKKRKIKNCDYVFPGPRGGLLSDVSVNKTLHAIEPGVTVHGMRSSFRDWVGDCTNFQREIAEASLAHAVGDETEQAYRRRDALEKRRKIMVAWANYVADKPHNVVRFVKVC